MSQNRITPSDAVKVEIFYESNVVYVYEGSGFSRVDEAVEAAFDAFPNKEYSVESYTFKVSDVTTGTSALYRYNAHDNLVLIPTYND